VTTAGLCVLAALTFRIFDTDFWQHLAVGRAIWEARAVPDRQIWCWPGHGDPFVLPSWAFRVLLWPVWQLGGVGGLYLWRWLVALAAFGLLWLTVRRMGVRSLAALPVLVVAALIYRQRSLVRPEALVVILLAAQLWLLESRRAGGRDRSAWIVAIAWIWANVHYSYHVGLGILTLYALDASWRQWRSRTPEAALARAGGNPGAGWKATVRQAGARRLWIVLGAAIAASFVNPFGAGTLIQPFEFFFILRHEPIYRTIGELQPLDWTLNNRNGLLGLLVLWPALQVARARRGKLDPVEGVLWLLLTPLVLGSQRFIGFWAVIAGLFAARDVGDWVSARRWPIWTSRPWARAGLASAACVMLTGVELTRSDFVPGVGLIESTYPRVACDFIERNDIRGRSFNHLELGGYLLWRFFPDPTRLPFMDVHLTGAADTRREYFQALVDPAGWERLDRRHRFDWVLLRRLHSPGDRVLDFVDADTAFALVFVDDASALYVRRSGPLAAVADSLALRVMRGGEAWLETLDARVAMDPGVGVRLESELRRLAVDSTASSSLENLAANLMLMQGRPTDARRHLLRARSVNRHLQNYHLRMGLIARDEGRPHEALAHFQAERRDGETVWLAVLLGSTYRRLGELERARFWFRRALRLDPGSQTARDSLAALDAIGR
jgi:tetratricopeptide (TPR) repeat protein